MKLKIKFAMVVFIAGLLTSLYTTTVRASEFVKPLGAQQLKDTIIQNWLKNHPIYPVEARALIKEYIDNNTNICAVALKTVHRVPTQLSDPDLSEASIAALKETLALAELDLKEHECPDFDAFVTKLLEKYNIYPVTEVTNPIEVPADLINLDAEYILREGWGMSHEKLKDIIITAWLKNYFIAPIQANESIETFVDGYSGGCTQALKLAHQVKKELAVPGLPQTVINMLYENLALAEHVLMENECPDFEAFVSHLMEEYDVALTFPKLSDISEKSQAYLEGCQHYFTNTVKECRLGQSYSVTYELYLCAGIDDSVFTEQINLHYGQCAVTEQETKHPYLGRNGYLKLP